MPEELETTVIGEVEKLIEKSDKGWLTLMECPEDLVEKISYEFYFSGAYNKKLIESRVKPIIEANKEELYKKAKKHC